MPGMAVARVWRGASVEPGTQPRAMLRVSSCFLAGEFRGVSGGHGAVCPTGSH